MNKFPKRYLSPYNDKIQEDGFHPERAKVSESLFSLSNEYMGVRGVFDEGSGSIATLRGVYFNGIYDYAKEDTPSAYKGIVKRTHFMINSVDWLSFSLIVNGEQLDLSMNDFSNFRRELSFYSGELIREFVWHLKCGLDIKIIFRRLLSMFNPKVAYQCFEMENLSEENIDYDVTFRLESNVVHWGKDCFWTRGFEEAEGSTAQLGVNTITSNQKLLAYSSIKSSEPVSFESHCQEMKCVNHLNSRLEGKKKVRFDKCCVFSVDKKGCRTFDEMKEEIKSVADSVNDYNFYLEKNKEYWKGFFDNNDIVIDGNTLDQQGIRFALFQLTSAYHGYCEDDNIGAKGLTGEAYSGHAFWDSETYCLPFYLLTNEKAAKDLLMFRYNTLNKAKERARMLDCDGACYPIATLNGEEGCNLWQHASLQFQPSTGVAYAIYHYFTLFKDEDFMRDYGLEMLIEISKFLLSRGQYDSLGRFGFYAVMGPDEFKMMVNNNAYTNYMAKKTFEYTLENVSKYSTDELLKKCNVTKKLIEDIVKACDGMYIPYDKERKLFEQNDGFFSLPHIDISSIPNEDFPLYSHWSYDRIYRYDMIKQPDVLMFIFLYSHCFSEEEKEANYDYYEPRCIHESSLSPSIHSIFATELGKEKEALSFFSYATRLDLDDYNNNTCEGIHMTSLAASFMNIVYGFGGLRSDDEILSIAPVLPKTWNSYSFSFIYHGAKIKVHVDKSKVNLTTDKEVKLVVYGNEEKIKDAKEYLIK